MMIQTSPRKAVILWALDQAEETVREIENKFPDTSCAREALASSRLWAQGSIKMPIARKTIIQCHAAVRSIDGKADIARFHSVGQACATVHTTKHAIGYPIYALTALIRDNGLDKCEELVSSKLADYRDRLLYWNQCYQDEAYQWASFLQETKTEKAKTIEHIKLENSAG